MNRLAHLRKSLKQDAELKKLFTQSGFAKLLGCSASLIRYLEQNDVPPSPALTLSIKEKLGIDPSWFSAPEGQSDAVVIAAAIQRIKSSENREKSHPRPGFTVSAKSFKIQGIISAVTSATAAALREDLERGDHALLDSIYELLGARGELPTLREITTATASRAELQRALASLAADTQGDVEAD